MAVWGEEWRPATVRDQDTIGRKDSGIGRASVVVSMWVQVLVLVLAYLREYGYGSCCQAVQCASM